MSGEPRAYIENGRLVVANPSPEPVMFHIRAVAIADAFLSVLEATIVPAAQAITDSGICDRLEALARATKR